MYVFLSYLLVLGVSATVDYLRYKGKVGLLSCVLASSIFPLYFLNLLIGVVFSFFGIAYVVKIGYVNFEALEKVSELDLDKIIKELESQKLDGDTSDSEEKKNLH